MKIPRFRVVNLAQLTAAVLIITAMLGYMKNTQPRNDLDIPEAANNSGQEDEPVVCQQPELDINDPTIMQSLKPPKVIDCHREPDWICPSRGRAAWCPHRGSNHSITCQYTFLKRVTDDVVVNGETIISDSASVRLLDDFFNVNCTNRRDHSTWKNLMMTIVRNESVARRTGFHRLPKANLPMNIIIIVFDSLSRMMFMRRLNRSYNYLTKTLNTVVLDGYNIVGDGTPQALIPIFTGKTELELPVTRRRVKGSVHCDAYPFVWRDFRRNGYVTAYADDMSDIGTFTYRLNGFKQQPTDHYYRTFDVELLRQRSRHAKLCVGGKPRHLAFFDWLRDFVQVYDDKPKFGFFFFSELSHDGNNPIASADGDLLDLLTWMKTSGILANTMLGVMSDHGFRVRRSGPSLASKLEERLPFVSFLMPDWFKSKHQQAFRNLRQNARRLTTPFDIHATFVDLLNFTDAGRESRADLSRRGISLFKNISPNRSCSDASIEPHWCACLRWQTVATSDPMIRKAAIFVVSYINDRVIGPAFWPQCAVLTLEQITSAQKLLPNEGLLKFSKSLDNDGFVPGLTANTDVVAVTYQVGIVTSHGDFEATLKYEKSGGRFSLSEPDISRTSKYGNASRCILDTAMHLRRFCHCLDPRLSMLYGFSTIPATAKTPKDLGP